MYAQVDAEGNQFQLLSEITDRRSDNSAIRIDIALSCSQVWGLMPCTTAQQLFAMGTYLGLHFSPKQQSNESTAPKVL